MRVGDTAGDRLMALILTETNADSDTIDAIVTELRNVEAEAASAARSGERGVIRSALIGTYFADDDLRAEQIKPVLDLIDAREKFSR